MANTAWNSGTVNPKSVTPFDQDGYPYSFSYGELNTIATVWQAVAEDFAPFDINVTTVRPASIDAFVRSGPDDQFFGSIAVITNDRWLCLTCGGVAYVGLFDPADPAPAAYHYAWTFSTPNWSARQIANVISHESGHNFGLSHDGVIGGSAYFSGTANWGPIMGNPVKLFVQWSKGEFPSANNTEDDIAMIGLLTGLADDTSSSQETAIQLPAGVDVYSPETTISASTDADYYSFDVTNGYLRLWVLPTQREPNLFADITMFNSAGQVVAHPIPYLPVAGVFAVFNGPLPNGRYHMEVKGREATTGEFTTYGSLGYYVVTAWRPEVPAAPIVTLAATGDQSFTANWSDPTNGSPFRTFNVQLCDEVHVCTAAISTSASSAILVAPRKSGRFTAEVTVADEAGLRSVAGVSGPLSVLSKPTAAPIQRMKWDPTTRALTIEWSGAVSHSPVFIDFQLLRILNLSNGDTTAANVGANPTGQHTFTIPQSWGGAQVEAIMFAYSSTYPIPWQQSDSTLAFLQLNRVGAPGAPATTVPRISAPPAGSGGSSDRTAAPPA